MRHRKKTVKLGRKTENREALMASLICNLILAKRIRTTLPKAKAVRRLAEKMVTVAKKNTLAARRLALSRLHRETPVTELFARVAPAMQERAGGYTRIVKLGKRMSDSSEMAILEWVDYVPQAPRKKKEQKAAPEAGGKTAGDADKK